MEEVKLRPMELGKVISSVNNERLELQGHIFWLFVERLINTKFFCCRKFKLFQTH